MGCEREAIIKLLVKLEKELSRSLEKWPEARREALRIIGVYRGEIEELLAEEPMFPR